MARAPNSFEYYVTPHPPAATRRIASRAPFRYIIEPESGGISEDRVTPDDLKELVTRLVKHEAWAQRIDERQPVPDESRATLETCYRDECVVIWEWYNDLEKNARIGDVLKFMQAIAWKPTAP